MSNKTKFLLPLLLCLPFLRAQEIKSLPRHPGHVIKYEIKFDGPNADKITTVDARMNTDQVPKDQAGFTPQFNTPGRIQAASPKTFVIEMKVPDNAATGEYHLTVDAFAAEGNAIYQDGQEFKVPHVQVDNPRKFTPPSITVKPLP